MSALFETMGARATVTSLSSFIPFLNLICKSKKEFSPKVRINQPQCRSVGRREVHRKPLPFGTDWPCIQYLH